MKTAWDNIKDLISSELPANIFSLWINPITFVEKKESTIILGCPNKFARKWVTENYMDLIHLNLQKAGLGHLDPLLKVQPPKKDLSDCPVITPAPRQLKLPNISGNGGHHKLHLNKDFVFDRFVVGHSNELAYSASSALANGELRDYNSLFMLANTGLGKTHLAQAVGHAILQKKPQSRLLYITAEDFMNEMVFSLKSNQIEKFKEKYRRCCDVLLLEQVHFLGGKEKTQAELGYTLDALANDDKKVIFTSSFPPKDIPKMSKELASRLTSGLLTTIHKPDRETRIKILTKKSLQQNLVLPEEVVHFLADHLTKDIRQMESALRGLKARAELLNKKIGLGLAKDAVSCFVSEEKSVSPGDIMNLVSKYYKVPQEMLKSKSRKRLYTYPRNIYIYLCRRHTDETIENIAKTINRSHSTVLYSSEVIEHKMKTDHKIRHQLNFLIQKIKSLKE